MASPPEPAGAAAPPGRRILARNSLWNLIGYGLPLAVAVFAVPPLIRGLGTDRFGVLTLAWVMVGYLSLFDLGVGRALTRAIAERRGAGRGDDLAAVTWTALALAFAFGLAGGAAMLALAGPIAGALPRVPPGLRGELRGAVAWLGLSLPFVLGTAGLRGILEAHQRFGVATAIRVPMGVYNFLAPLAVLPWSRDLGAIVGVLAVGRVAAWAAHLAAAWAVMPELRRFRLAPARAAGLLREGGWMSVSNVIGPVLVYVDRFLLGAFASLSEVAWYATPFELVTRLLVIPQALAGVLFPAFASDHGARAERADALYARGVLGVLVVLFPCALLLSAFAPEVLRLWVGATFAAHGTVILRWLAAGVVLNAVAHVPFARLQAAGRSRHTAQLHLVETPLYLAGATWAIRALGARGAALAWTTRVALDAVALFALAAAAAPEARAHAPRRWGALAAALAALLAADLVPGLAARVAIVAAALAADAVAAWRWLLADADQARLRTRLASLAGR